MLRPAANTGQTKMAAKLYSDMPGILSIFNKADRQAGGTSATLFGLKRWEQLNLTRL